MLSEKMERVLDGRTRHLTVVVEELYQPHNGAAVIRACECFGIQDLHVICSINEFKVSEDIVAGADRWISLHYHTDTKSCLTALKQRGYRILATSLRDGCIPVGEVDLSQKTALCFGTELKGLSEVAHQMADGFVRIPMYGFTQSFNISVSAALCMFELSDKLHEADTSWQLSAGERQELRALWRQPDKTTPPSTII